ncbi:MAG: malonyl CoA-acyl carrier protein transacylase [Schlesneria sp.]|nr:malonyl CoA-acyl carrier protein transacylase [Schlesneria sp.]
MLRQEQLAGMSEGLWFESAQAPGAECGDTLSHMNWLFPGLGCRYVGMGHDLFDRPGIAGKLIRQAEEALGYPLAPVCLEGSGRKIVSPRQEAQAIYVINCAYAAALREHGHFPNAVLGHSLGTWSAAWVAGVYDFLTGLELITHVELLLEELADGHDLAMGAIIGLDEVTVEDALTAKSGITIANFNSPAQFVIGGPGKDVDDVLHAALVRGAKQAKRLPTGRAIHTPWMQEVANKLKLRLDQVSWSDPKVPFVACDCANKLGTATEVHRFFSIFLAQPVRWQQSFCTLSGVNTSPFLEVGPGTLLKTLAWFIDSSVVVRSATDCLEVA